MASKTRFLPATTDPALAWVFPGQGSQQVGMGRDLWYGSAAARGVFETADRVLGYELSAICFEGPEERLRDTYYSQPAIFVTSVACLAAALEQGAVRERPAIMAGHSLGEYSALVAAGSLSLEDGIVLIQERARLMAAAAEVNPGTLAAIIGLDEERVLSICEEAGAEVCNLNQPAQTVVGGSREAVARAIELAKAAGAARALELNVSGAFHSSLMTPAVAGMAEAVRRVTIEPPLVPVIGNVGVQSLKDDATIREELAAQVAQPVRWHESVSLIAGGGVTSFIEFGPGRVLTGLIKRIVPGATLRNVSALADIATARV